MISYATVGTNDFEKSIPFYTELLGTQGVIKLFDHPRGVFFAKGGKAVLGVLKPVNGKAASAGNGAMIAFEMPTCVAVDAFHAKAIALGAADDGAPGDRGHGFYMAYFRDLEGNKFCASCSGG